MELGLGIDAGGTYTDVVLLDFATQQILATAKALTTKECLRQGVAGAIEQLPAALLQQVCLVSLSTTLATNAIVEKKGGKVGAILLGFDDYDVARIHHAPRRVVAGKTDITGAELVPLHEEALCAAARDLLDHEQVDALVISGMVSVKNPAQEIRARLLISELSDKPLVCGHEVSMQLDTMKRTDTAILNARLLPIIAELLRHVQAALAAVKIQAPLMVVRGDGTLMGEAMARTHPVETILSGPASSVCGACFLAHVRNGLVVDIGGTTSDIALIIDGQPVVSRSGARIAEWSTNVCAVDIDTLGFGGDSAISLTEDGRLGIGPRRAIPLAYLAAQYPRMLDEMQRLWRQRATLSTLKQPVECFLRVKERMPSALTAREVETMEALRDGPRSREALAEHLGVLSPSLVPVDGLETLGYIQRATLTPTDVLHYQGRFTAWNRDAAELGLRLFAHRAGTSVAELAPFILDTFAYWLTRYLMNRLIRHPHAVTAFPMGVSDRALLEMMSEQREKFGLTLQARYRNPLVAIGAPAGALAPAAAEKLGATLIIPPHAEVANAVGAITGTLLYREEVTITATGKDYIVHSPMERREFRELPAAKSWASAHVTHILDERVAGDAPGRFAFQREVTFHEHIVDTPHGPVFLECQVRGSAVGKPSLYIVR